MSYQPQAGNGSYGGSWQQPHPQAPPGPIIYGSPRGQTDASSHYTTASAAQQGQWRTLNVDLRNGGWGTSWSLTPFIIIDGMRMNARWGKQSFWVPADRPVHVQCYAEYLFRTGESTIVLGPGGDIFLEYTAPVANFTSGSIGPPGTTKVKGWPLALAVPLISLTLVSVMFIFVLL